MKKLTLIDFFCGAGGFSEGFRQQDFEIISGYDYWKPAVDTYNHNFGEGKGILKDILDFETSVEEIEALPDTDVILGSPPCVSFSNSNNSGKADKSLGVKLTETFLRIVAVKKFQPNSKLKAWFMENVTNSTTYLAREYTFKDLSLSQWAIKHRLSPKKVAIKIFGNSVIVNSAEYGSAQVRKRVITGEMISKNSLVVPPKTHAEEVKELFDNNLLPFNKIGFIKSILPKPSEKRSDELITDPLYPNIQIKLSELTDHFYDTGLYASEWNNSKFLKVNHPYMGTMSFPENEDKPSRTITATKIGTSREAIIYKSEYNRIGDGEFRTATVREAASIMGFPITYQFIGSEGTKWRLVGNAVCPSVSRSLASVTRTELGMSSVIYPNIQSIANLEGVPNLNSFKEKVFDVPKKRKSGSRFRRHPFKEGNITVTLSNYDILNNDKEAGKWVTSVQYGNGEGFPSYNYDEQFYKSIEPIIESFENGKEFIKIINNGFSEKIAKKDILQKMHEEQHCIGEFLEPTALIENVVDIIQNMKFAEPTFIQNGHEIFKKKMVPKKQLLVEILLNVTTPIRRKLTTYSG